MQVIEALGLSVLRDTALGGAFNPGFAPSVAGVLCSRSSIVPGAFDDEVIWLGLPLHITQSGLAGPAGRVEIDHGRYRYRMIEGPAPDAGGAECHRRPARRVPGAPDPGALSLFEVARPQEPDQFALAEREIGPAADAEMQTR